MKKLAPVLSLLIFMLPPITSAAALTSQQSSSLIAVVQSSPGTPASAFVSLITAFSNITTAQASSLITVVQAAPGVPANAFVNLLTSFTVDTSTTPTVTPVATTQTQNNQQTIQISSVNIVPSVTSAKIQWKTNIPTESKIFISGGTLSSQVYNSDSGLSTNHSVSAGNLSGGTNYSYEIEAIASGVDTKNDGSFSTTPIPLSISQLRFSNSVDVYIRSNKELASTLQIIVGGWAPISELQTWNFCRTASTGHECVYFNSTEAFEISGTQAFYKLDGDASVYHFKLDRNPYSYGDGTLYFKLRITATDGTTYTTHELLQNTSSETPYFPQTHSEP